MGASKKMPHHSFFPLPTKKCGDLSSWISIGVFKEESNTFLLFIIVQGNNNDSNHRVDHRPGRQRCDGPSLFSTMRHLFIFCAHCGTKTKGIVHHSLFFVKERKREKKERKKSLKS